MRRAYQTPSRPAIASTNFRQVCKRGVGVQCHCRSLPEARNPKSDAVESIRKQASEFRLELQHPASRLPIPPRFSIVWPCIPTNCCARSLTKKAPKQVAADLGLSLSMVYKWAEPPNHASGSGTGNPLDRIEALLHKHRRPPARPMDLPARRRLFHSKPEAHAASAFPDSRHQPDRPGIRRPAPRHRRRHR